MPELGNPVSATLFYQIGNAMHKKLLFAFSILLLTMMVPGKTVAQCFATVTGQVLDANTQQPVANQVVFVEVPITPNTAYAAPTNPNGVYSINVPVPCGTTVQSNVYTVGCGDSLFQYQILVPDSIFNIPFYVCDTNGTNPPNNCSGVVSVSSIEQGIALSYQIPGANEVNVVFGDNPNVIYHWPANHVFPDSGTYDVCVTAYIGQCIWDTCFTVDIAPFSGTDSCYVQGLVTPYGNNGIEFGWLGANSLGLVPSSVVWDFGDGNSSNNYPNGGLYTYAAPGTYNACVTVTWATGCVSTACQTVTVSPAPFTVCGWVGYTVGTDTLTYDLNCGVAYLIAIDSTGQHTVVDSVSVTPNGYCFYGQAPGNYTVLIVPCDSTLLPTYLGNVLFWQDAAVYSGYGGIVLVSGQNVQGPGLIGGTVVWGDKAVGDPIEGIRVLLLDVDANPIKFATTDVEGYYSFGNLPYGTYRVYPEFPGYTTYPGLVILSAENPVVTSANFSLNTDIFMGIEEAPAAIQGLFPNPVADKTTLTMVSKESGNGSIQIVDLAGKTVASFPVSLTQGQQNLSIDATSLKAGMYTVTLIVRGQSMHTKLIKQ